MKSKKNTKSKNLSEDLQIAFEKLEKGFLSTLDQDNFKNYLKFQSKNYNHSSSNCILANYQFMNLQFSKGIEKPKPITLLKSEIQWNELGRDIKANEQSLTIFAPIKQKVTDRTGIKTRVTELFRPSKRVLCTLIPRKLMYKGNGNYIYSSEVISIEDKQVIGFISTISNNIMSLNKQIELIGIFNKNRGFYQIQVDDIKQETNIKFKEKYIVTGYKTAQVFDLCQTESDDIPSICNALNESDNENISTLLGIIEKIIPIPIEEFSNRIANGYYSPFEKKIGIKSSLSNIHKLKTLIHEFGHFKLDNQKFKNKIKKIGLDTYAIEELIVESTSYMICSYYEIDTSDYSFAYLCSWSNCNVENLRRTFKLIQELYSIIFEEIKNNL